ncbi:neuronal acetylcholine receptor subunit alpha-7-like [Mya arenaria]|uniref:neuronal acetylcholine receptor subunit alpha-7-like n=1 Tax=Mya arenaria TaxID=6604 RepID=UPI0022E787C5|nr:neuronal acetylcholine receptor subunit alpha-7-like [Mya arenaria]
MRTNVVSSVCFLLLLELFSSGAGSNVTDSNQLYDDLIVTAGYNARNIPSANYSVPLPIKVELSLLAINELDDVGETFRVTGYLSVKWKDASLVWKASDYNGLYSVTWPQKDVWHPDITLSNSFLDYQQVGDDKLLLYIAKNGKIYWYPFQLDMTSDGVYLGNFEASSSWDIVDTLGYTDTNQEEPNVRFRITMKRKPLFIIVTVVFPILACALLNICVFLLPVESGERAGYSVTIFLALAVFLTIISTTLPANSEKIAIFSVYLIITTVASTVTTIIALFTIRISIFQNPIPQRLNKAMNFITCKTRKNRKITTVEPIDTEAGKSDLPTKVATSEEAGLELKDYTWNDVIRFIDVGCIFFFFTVIVLSTVICLAIAAL